VLEVVVVAEPGWKSGGERGTDFRQAEHGQRSGRQDVPSEWTPRTEQWRTSFSKSPKKNIKKLTWISISW
jgi:hypothetical protein